MSFKETILVLRDNQEREGIENELYDPKHPHWVAAHFNVSHSFIFFRFRIAVPG